MLETTIEMMNMKHVLPMSLFLIPYGQGSGTTVAIPINENTNQVILEYTAKQ
jgi:hypothetical protein